MTLPDIAAPDLRAPMATEVTLTARVTDLRRQLQQARYLLTYHLRFTIHDEPRTIYGSRLAAHR